MGVKVTILAETMLNVAMAHPTVAELRGRVIKIKNKDELA